MGRKDLSRTVIEGGRRFSNCDDRRASHGIERARTREWLDQVKQDVEQAEDTVVPARPRVIKQFHDKLAPAHRWIDSQVGRPWAKVRSELIARFDARTVAGRHVLYDHMLRDVSERGPEVNIYGRALAWYVDIHGILRRNPWSGASGRRRYAEVRAWRGARRAVLTYCGWWWYFRSECDLCRTYGECRQWNHAGYRAVRFVPERPLGRSDLKRLTRRGLSPGRGPRERGGAVTTACRDRPRGSSASSA